MDDRWYFRAEAARAASRRLAAAQLEATDVAVPTQRHWLERCRDDVERARGEALLRRAEQLRDDARARLADLTDRGGGGGAPAPAVTPARDGAAAPSATPPLARVGSDG